MRRVRGTAGRPAHFLDLADRAEPRGRDPPEILMIVGMFVSAAIAVFGLLVALGRIGHPIDAQLVSNYGWSILIIGVALFVLFAFGRFSRTRKARSVGRSA
ncbi:hypothetical protein ACRAWG_24020 [Methylobacterium sp. P31]